MLSKAVQNAVNLIRTLHTNPGTKLKDFAEAHDLSPHFMEQIGLKLVRADILISVRGPGGGYILKKKDISLVEIFNVFTVTKKLTPEDQISKDVIEALKPIRVI